MKKLLVSFLSIGFISATCIFVSCSKKKDEPAPTPVPATTTGGSTTGTTTSGTTSGSTSSSTASNNSFNDGTNYPNATSSLVPGGSTTIQGINLSQGSGYPIVTLGLKKPLTVGTYTNITNGQDNFMGIAYSNSLNDTYLTPNTGGSYTLNITSVTSTEVKGTFSFTGTSPVGSKSVTGTFSATLSSGSTTSNTTSGSTTSGTTTSQGLTILGSGTGTFNDGISYPNSNVSAYTTTGSPNNITVEFSNSSVPSTRISVSLKKPLSTGVFTSNDFNSDFDGTAFYGSGVIYSTLFGGTNTITITTATSTSLIGSFSFNAKYISNSNSKAVTGNFNITLN